jgi:short subunit dehydrogenase-like uncharacterized protein
VIEACVAGGAHYMDLTGEIPFVRRMIEEFHGPAEEAGVKIVEISGFESLPPDLGVLLATQTARERWGEALSTVDLEVTIDRPPGLPRPSDALSGGTLQSLAAITGHEDTAVITDPAALVPDPAFAAEVRRRSPITVAPRVRHDGTVIAPMAPAAYINPAVIHRTASLLGSEAFRYREGIAMPGGPASLPLRAVAAGALSATQLGMSAVIRARPSVRQRVSRALERTLPSSGFGPAADRLEGWQWRVTITGRATGGHEVRVHIDGDGHPGYLTTATMLGEAGLLLAEPGLTPKRAGCLTPAAALGTASIDRFARARLRFAVSD